MAKVSLRACTHYDYSLVREGLQRTIDDLGGLERYIKSGDTVLLKVNLLMKKAPEKVTTTHPVFVKALSDILVAFGARVIIADSPGGPYNKGALESVYRGCGYLDLPTEDGAVRLNYDTRTKKISRDDLILLKQMEVIAVMEEADHVFDVCKLKTHGMTVYTGAVKNMFGTIPGILKAEYHFKMPRITDFTQMLVDVCVNAGPTLTFMDAIVGMEGAGPSAGDPVAVGAIIASDSPYHLDVVATRLVGIDPMEVPTIERTVERGLVREDYGDIEFPGLQIEDFPKRSIKRPRVGGIGFLENKVPQLLQKPLNRMMNPKPVFDPESCVLCGDCMRACPTGAITLGKVIPRVDLDKCIRCFCCQELCPHEAVAIYRNPVLEKIIRL
ncbi:MAG: iron-sulfur protein [delta proteobacterium ML8_F1]|nr:MAG: iron-sulfur protein [delta proteobacterium ML8_F1]